MKHEQESFDEKEDHKAHKHKKKRNRKQREGNKHFGNVEAVRVKQESKELFDSFVQNRLQEQAIFELPVSHGPTNDSGKTIGLTKLKKKKRKQGDKERENAELIDEGDGCCHNPQSPSKKSKKRKKHHSASKTDLERNVTIEGNEVLDRPFEERDETARDHKRKKKRKKRSRELEGGNVLQSGMVNSITKAQNNLDDGEMVQHLKIKVGTDENSKEKKHKKRRSKTRKYIDLVVSPEGLCFEKERANEEVPEIPCPTDCISLPGGTCSVINDVAATREKKPKRKSHSEIHEVRDIAPYYKKRKHDNHSTINDSCLCDFKLNNNVESNNQNICTQKERQRKTKDMTPSDIGLPNKEPVLDQTGVNLRLMSKVIDLTSDIDRQDIETNNSRKIKKKKRKHNWGDKVVENAANNCESSQEQMIADQKDFSFRPKRRKTEHKNDANNTEKEISKQLKAMTSKRSNVQWQLDGTSKNQDKREVNRNASQKDEKRSHVKETWFEEADDLNSDKNLGDFAFPSIHGTGDVSSSSESDVQECLKASIKQTIASMKEMSGSSQTVVDGICVEATRTGRENVAQFDRSNQKCSERKTDDNFSSITNNKCDSGSFQARQAKDSVSKGANYGIGRKKDLDPELRFLWNLKPADIEELKREGIEFETGTWTKDETEILESNMIEFCDTTGMSLEDLKNLISDRSTVSRKTKKELGVYYILASGLNRKMKDVHRKLMRTAHPSHALGAWTFQEEMLFSELYQKYGSQWSIIGREMGRSQDSVRDQMIRIQRGKVRKGVEDATEIRTLGRWKSDEEQRLVIAVEEFFPKTKVKGDKENDKEMPIYWRAVAVRVKTRNAEQCRTKWLYDLSWKKPGQDVKKWTNQDLAKFLTVLRDSREKYEKHVNWMKIGKDLGRPEPGTVLRLKWLHFKRQVPGFKLLEFQEILDWLVKNKVSKLLGK